MNYAFVICAIALLACVSAQSFDTRKENINSNFRGILETLFQLGLTLDIKRNSHDHVD